MDGINDQNQTRRTWLARQLNREGTVRLLNRRCWNNQVATGQPANLTSHCKQEMIRGPNYYKTESSKSCRKKAQVKILLTSRSAKIYQIKRVKNSIRGTKTNKTDINFLKLLFEIHCSGNEKASHRHGKKKKNLQCIYFFCKNTKACVQDT